TPPNLFAGVKITTLPGVGTLKNNNLAVGAGQVIPVSDITAGNLKFTPTAGTSGSPYTTFTFQVSDNGGTANAGVDTDQSPNTLTINVTPVNSAPSGTDGSATTLEDTPLTLNAANFGFSDPNDSPPNLLAAVKVTTLPALGTL